MEIQKPYCVAMVRCDAVHRDPAPGKYTLLGTFMAVRTSLFIQLETRHGQDILDKNESSILIDAEKDVQKRGNAVA